MIQQEARLRQLVEAGILLSSELALEAVLQRLVELAAGLTGARYAALGVISPDGRTLERFLTTGIDEAMEGEIGDPPIGRGILGALIRDATPLRLTDLSEDPRSVGFPPGHPPMRTFLGVPVLLRGNAYGNLYLTEKQGGEPFSEDDQDVVTMLAAQAAVAIENARLYESSSRWMRQLETMAEIGNALVGNLELPRILDLVCQRLRGLLGARSVHLALRASDGSLEVVAAADDHDISRTVGLPVPLEGTLSGRAFTSRRAFRVDSFIDDPQADLDLSHRFAELAGLPSPTAGIFVPLLVRDRAIGVIVAHDRVGDGASSDLRFDESDVRLAEVLAARAAVAVDLSLRVEREALRRVVAAQETERQRLARELHDDTGQALTSMLLGLRTAEEAPDEETRRATLASLRELATSTLQDVRRLAVELRPKALDDFGLVPALERLVEGYSERTGIAAQFEGRLEERLAPEKETALYRIVQEGLTNVMKHAGATGVTVLLAAMEGKATVIVEDNGSGFDPEQRFEGMGLLGMRERLELVDGQLTIESSPAGGTTLVAEVPVS